MKKSWIFPFMLVLFSQLVFAAQESVGEAFLDLIFGSSELSILFLKAMLVIVLTTALYKGALNLFPRQSTAFVIAILTSILAVRFIPELIITILGQYIMVALVIALPWFLGGLFLPSGWPRAIFAIISYAGLTYLLLNFSNLSVYLPDFANIQGGEIFTDFFYFLFEYKILVITVLAIISLLALLITKRQPVGKGLTWGTRKVWVEKTNIFKWFISLILITLGIYVVLQGYYYIALGFASALVIYWFIISKTGMATRTRTGIKTYWFRTVIVILVGITVFLSWYMGFWYLALSLLGLLIIIYLITKPKKHLLYENLPRRGTNVMKIIVGILSFAIAAGLTFFGYWWVATILIGILILIWIITSPGKKVEQVRLHFKGRWLWWIVGALTLIIAFSVTYFVHWVYGLIGLAILIIIWFFQSNRLGIKKLHSNVSAVSNNERFVWLILLILVSILMLLSWIFPDPIPFIDEILLPIIDLWLLYKNVKT